jgi:hypothetical protein
MRALVVLRACGTPLAALVPAISAASPGGHTRKERVGAIPAAAEGAAGVVRSAEGIAGGCC